VKARALLAAVVTIVLAASLVGSVSSAPKSKTVTLTPIGTHASDVFFDEDAGVGAAEIPAYDWFFRRLFVVNAVQQRVDVLSLANPASPTKLFHIDVSDLGTPNSVDTHLGLVAVAVEAPVRTDAGKVAFFRLDGSRFATVDVGAVPDMLTFSRNGRFVLVANEGETAAGIDPMGSVSVIDLRRGARRASVGTADFTAFDGKTLDPSVIVAAGKLPSVDLEPEYITVSEDSRKAWVTLQDANSVAEIGLVQQNFNLGRLTVNRHSRPRERRLDPTLRLRSALVLDLARVRGADLRLGRPARTHHLDLPRWSGTGAAARPAASGSRRTGVELPPHSRRFTRAPGDHPVQLEQRRGELVRHTQRQQRARAGGRRRRRALREGIRLHRPGADRRYRRLRRERPGGAGVRDLREPTRLQPAADRGRRAEPRRR
jgi:hypothetical protein